MGNIRHIESCSINCKSCGGSSKCAHISTNHTVRLDPIIYCLIIYDQLKERVRVVKKHSGIDTVENLLTYLDQNSAKFNREMVGNIIEIPEHVRQQHAEEHEAATRCYACQTYFTDGDDKFGKVFDHDHHTGEF